jgi:hypothetical protein
VRLLIKILLLAFTVYAVTTAASEDKNAMLEGGRAFVNSFREACTRPGSPCTAVIDSIRRIVDRATGSGEPSVRSEIGRPPWRELDGSPRHSSCCWR